MPEAAEDSIEEVNPAILEKLQQILSKLGIKKIYFVDDAVEQQTDGATFKGLVQSVLAEGKIDDLRAIPIKGIDFTQDVAVLPEHIDQVWDGIKHSKQLRYFESVHKIAGQPDAIRDLNVSNNLKDFFSENQIEFLTPGQWEEQRDAILGTVTEENKLMVLFDQDLKLAGGRYADQAVQGEQLILELKQKGLGDKVVVALLTHTITSCEEELPTRQAICDKFADLENLDFFVLAKIRLEKPGMFADGIKKICINRYCEEIKGKTIDILKEAQQKTIERLEKFDTYDFDHTVFKSSQVEGVWEPETLLRIVDVIFKDEVRTQMMDNGYVPSANTAICSASDISKIEFIVDGHANPYKERFELRHQEIYESGKLLNGLRKPIDNGDIFEITEGIKKGRKFILVAQECDLMVRGDGFRGARIATMLEIETMKETKLFSEMRKKYEGEIKKEKFQNHFFSDKYRLDYFDFGTNDVGLVHFGDNATIDLNVLDLIVFNAAGEAELDLGNSPYDKLYHNQAWRKRYELVHGELMAQKDIIEAHFAAVDANPDGALKTAMKEKFSHLFSFINKKGIQLNYHQNKYQFGIRRIARLRLPKSKNLLDRYYQHLSRFAEQHDFID